MNFFKSILSDDPDPPHNKNPYDSDSESGESSADSSPGGRNKNDSTQQPDHENPNPNQSTDDNTGGWSFGGLINTFTTRSESLIETYRRDLKEFGSGLTKETDILREVASRAVKDLPASLEAGASAAQGSLESVGQALDGVLKSTAEIISKESLIFASDGESDTAETNRSATPGTYSRFEAQLSAIQNDVNTFVEEPEDVDEFKKWKLGFELGEKKGEMEWLIGENGNLGGVYKKVVPSTVDSETFWCRYFYRVRKLEQQERMRANLVKRTNLVDDEEELSWDFDDEDDNKESELKSGIKAKGADGSENIESSDKSLTHDKREGSSSNSEDDKEVNDSNSDINHKKNLAEASNKSSEGMSVVEKVKSEDIAEPKNDQEIKPKESVIEEKNDERVKSEDIAELKNDQEMKSKESVIKEKNDEKVGVEENGDSDKIIDVLVNSNHESKVDEEDIGWDEIEGTGSDDEKKVSVSSDRSLDLRKQMNVADDDEDLSWDIEDDDKPMKA